MWEMFRIRLTIKLAPRKQESHNFTDRYEYESWHVVKVWDLLLCLLNADAVSHLNLRQS
jgi:hypothetical protein